MKTIRIIVLLLLGLPITGKGQSELYIAQDMVEDYRYSDAIAFYQKALDKKESKDAITGIANCYRILRQYPDAEKWYAKAYGKDKSDPQIAFELGMMLKANGRYDRAIQLFDRYVQLKPEDSLRANQQIAGCKAAPKWMENPGSVMIMNRRDMNSPYSEFGVIAMDPDEDLYVYSTNRKEEGSRKKDLATESNLPYFSLRGIRLNTIGMADQAFEYQIGASFPYHMATPSFTINKDTVFFTQTTVSHEYKEVLNRMEVFYSAQGESGWSKPEKIDYQRRQYSYGHPFVTDDGNRLFFISDMPGGIGGYDIWYSRKVDGKWEKPENLGPGINTPEDEFFPMYHQGDLYFSSAGHVGMGGLDLFRSHDLDGNWGTPVNLKPPYNSPQDDFALTYVTGKEHVEGFLASNRDGGLGADDIYAFTGVEPKPPVYLVTLVPKDASGYLTVDVKPSQILVKEVDKGNERLPETFTSVTGQEFIKVYPDRDYSVTLNMEDYYIDPGTLQLDEGIAGDTILVEGHIPYRYGIKMRVPVTVKKFGAGEEYVVERIYFDYNSAQIRKDAEPALNQLLFILEKNPDYKIEIGSHCDSRGTDAYNMRLSEKRARAVRNYLSKNGISRRRLSYKGYGETQILNHCGDGVKCTELEHEANRRTTFTILKE